MSQAMPSAAMAEVLRRPRRIPLFLEPFVRIVREKPLATFGGAILLIMIIAAVFAPWISPYDPVRAHSVDRLLSPNLRYLLGTDNLGRDLLSRIIGGARTSLYVGLGAVMISITGASIAGTVSGYFGGMFDTAIQRVVDAFMSFPWLVIMLTVMAVLGPGMTNVTIALGIVMTAGQSRTVRSATLAIKENQYVEAARAIGCTNFRILLRYVLPNVFAPIIVVATVGLAGAILAEASLSYLGFGVPPPNPSWGRDLTGMARPYMLQAPWMAVWPGLAISLAVFGINMLGDGLRDVLDPRLRGAQGARFGARSVAAQG